MSSSELKKTVGRIILGINNDILELQGEYKAIQDGKQPSKKCEKLEKSVMEKKKALEDTKVKLENNPDYVTKEKLEKTVKMLTDNIVTATNVLESRDVIENDIEAAKNDAIKSLDDIENKDYLNLEALKSS